MDFNLSKEQLDIYSAAASAAACFNVGLTERDKEQRFDRLLWKTGGEHLFPGLAVPEKYGGRDLDVINTMLALQGIGHLLSVVVPIFLYGTEKQKKHYLPALCNGNWIGANAMTETETGSDVFSMKTTAIKQGTKYMLRGKKDYCSNAPVADIILAYAVTNPSKGFFGGVSAFILEREKSHFRTSKKIDKMGLRSCEMGAVFFEEVLVDAEALLGKEGGGAIIFLKSMDWERIGLSALHIGTLERLLTETETFVKQRKVFGKAIGKFQAIAHKLVDLRVETEATKLLIYKAACTLQQNKSADLLASMAKLKTSELYKNGLLDLLQIFGATGYVGNTDIARTLRDAVASTLYSGSSEIQKNLSGKK